MDQDASGTARVALVNAGEETASLVSACLSGAGMQVEVVPAAAAVEFTAAARRFRAVLSGNSPRV